MAKAGIETWLFALLLVFSTSTEGVVSPDPSFLPDLAVSKDGNTSPSAWQQPCGPELLEGQVMI